VNNTKGVSAATIAASPPMGALHQSYSSSYGFNRTLSLGLKRTDFNSSTNHVNIVSSVVNPPKSLGGDIWSRCLAKREGGMSTHKVSGLSVSRLPPNHDIKSHGVHRTNGEIDGASAEGAVMGMN
jgi:hypothetical protein